MTVAEKAMNMEFRITWRPFFLDARLPGGEGKDKLSHYKSKFGEERVAQMMPRMVQTFKDEGIDGYSIAGRVGNTMDSHRLLEHALAIGGPEKQDALVEVLFDRYFLKGRALSSHEVLLDAAKAASIDGAEQLLASESYTEQVWSEVEKAYQSGVTGVPYFRIDGGGPGKELSGGQPPDVFLRIFAGLGTAAPSASAAALGFAAGSHVRVRGVQAKPEHNGKSGKVVGAQGERVQIRLADGTELALRPANIEPADVDAA